MGNYKPHARQAETLSLALSYVESVDYAVSARWLFYRLLQDGIYPAKGDYKSKFLPMLSKARKNFYDGWYPDTLADDTRHAILRGNGYASESDWLRAVGEQLACSLDMWDGQPTYLEIWFEAKAMAGQFRHYTDYITLVPFGGDPSVPFKWSIAKRLDRRINARMVILYFGDLDPKGVSIPESALRDIRQWCHRDFEFVRCGLNPGDEITYCIPQNPDKPGEYQWEALNDQVARSLITESISQFISPGYFLEIEQLEEEITKRFKLAWQEFCL